MSSLAGNLGKAEGIKRERSDTGLLFLFVVDHATPPSCLGTALLSQFVFEKNSSRADKSDHADQSRVIRARNCLLCVFEKAIQKTVMQMCASTCGNEAQQSTERPVQPGHRAVLSGFCCPFLDMREFTFVEPIESCRICVFCKRVPGLATQLPCFHIVCYGCRDKAFWEHEEQYLRSGNNAAMCRLHALCPMDYTPFDQTHLLGKPANLPRVQEKLVYCLQAKRGCQYWDKLKHLKWHYYNDCPFGPNSSHH